MNATPGTADSRFDARAFVRSVWKPILAFIGLLIGTILFLISNPSEYWVTLIILSVVLLLPFWAPAFQFIHAIIHINGNDHQDLKKFTPMSRSLGFLVYGTFLGAMCFLYVMMYQPNNAWIVCVFGVSTGLAFSGCVSQIVCWTPQHNRFVRANTNKGVKFASAVLSSIPVFAVIWSRDIAAAIPINPEAATYVGLYHFVILFTLCWLAFHRQAIELFLEPIVWILYSIRATGPSAYQLPPAGPVLIVANHASWLDPVFLAKVLPRPITPMMTSKFYDIWFLRPLLKYVFKVIVVPDVKVRREAPELQLAIAALDRGEVVVIFPEGALRRKEDVPLKRFGQGVHMILRERPDTPVISCWIEGAWGSYCSYFNGPPTKNKKIDIRRKIEVAVGEPEAVPEEVLAGQMATRIFLMNRVLESRELLGLPPLPRFKLLEKADEEGE